MLEGLDRVNWKELEHAYGPAEDVPDLLRALASDNAEVRKKAQWHLWGNIIHQGTVYSATSYAVPFLLELLEAPTVTDKPELLSYVAALACGSSYHVVHEPLFEKMGVYQEEMKQPEWHERIQKEVGWVKAAWLAVVAGTPVSLNLLNDSDPATRRCAAYTLAVAKPRAAEIVPRLQERLMMETDDSVRASILLSLGCLSGTDLAPLLLGYLAPTNDAVVATAAALSLARISGERTPQAAIQELCEALRDPQAVDDVYLQLPWSDGESVVAAVSNALGGLGPAAADFAVPRIMDALEDLPEKDTGSITMVGTILSLVFDARKEAREAKELSALQREVLRRLARCDRAWDWGNVFWTFQHFGLPDRKEKLAEFVKLD